MNNNNMKKLSVLLVLIGIFLYFSGNIYAATSTSVINTSSTTAATQPSTMQHLVRTSDGTMHAFVQNGTLNSSCIGVPKNGLVWMNSTDTGSTWTCAGQLSTDTTNLMYASATVDSGDNIYVVYSVVAAGAAAAYDVTYRKFTKGVGSTWTIENAQTVLDGTVSVGYGYATIQVEGTTRLWIASRYYDGGNYQVSVHYSDGLTASPSWTVSQTNLNTVGTNSSYHMPSIVRFGTNIGIVYNAQLPSASQRWRIRADFDGLTTWTPEAVVSTSTVGGPQFSTISDSAGNVYHAINNGAGVYFVYWNGLAWSATATVSSVASGGVVSLTTDGVNVWVFFADTTNLSGNLTGYRKLSYKKGVLPYTTADFDITSTPAVSYHGTFDKYWSYNGSTYTDDTTDAGNVTATDTSMNTVIDSIAYFGKIEKFDTAAWSMSTNGGGWSQCVGILERNNMGDFDAYRLIQYQFSG